MNEWLYAQYPPLTLRPCVLTDFFLMDLVTYLRLAVKASPRIHMSVLETQYLALLFVSDVNELDFLFFFFVCVWNQIENGEKKPLFFRPQSNCSSAQPVHSLYQHVKQQIFMFLRCRSDQSFVKWLIMFLVLPFYDTFLELDVWPLQNAEHTTFQSWSVFLVCLFESFFQPKGQHMLLPASEIRTCVAFLC